MEATAALVESAGKWWIRFTTDDGQEAWSEQTFGDRASAQAALDSWIAVTGCQYHAAQ